MSQHTDDRSISRRELLRGALGAAGLLAVPSMAGGGEARALAVAAKRPIRSVDFVDAALKADRWIRSVRVATTAGVAWPADPTQPGSVTTSLYTGTPGVVLFLLELHHTTGERAALEDARKGADELIASLPAPERADHGLYTGLAGIGFVLAETWRATDDARYRTAALRIVDRIREAATPAGDGVEWSDSSDIISGGAGIALFLLYAHDVLGADTLELANRASRRLLALGQPSHDGLKWAIGPRVPNLYPNFSHGAAGVGYALASVHQRTNERALLDGARAAARYLDAVADRTDGCKVFHHEPGGERLYYLSWCHGGAGTSRLFYRLGEVTGDAAWTERIHCYARGMLAMGVPEQRSPGYWNNISQCCGNAGVGEFFRSLDRLYAGRGYGEVAVRAGEDVVRRGSASSGGLRWVQAEHRVQPDNLVAQTGFMQGAAGTGTLFLHLHAHAAGRAPAIRLPDSPYA